MSIYKAIQLLSLGLLVSRLRHGRNLQQVQPSSTDKLVSVIIPARNEAKRIATCLEALEGVHEVIVVDDCSTDDTADLAGSLGAKVVTGAPLPDGWVGKPWAMQQGLVVATGDIVIFLDADTIAQPGLIGAVVEQLDSNDIVSFAARFRCSSNFETALHASMLATLVYRFGPPGSPLSNGRTIANGQCIGFVREWLIEQGGFESNKANMTDDVALVRRLSSRGASVAFVDGGDVLEVDMHDSVVDVWKEWGRSLPMSDATSTPRQAIDNIFLWVTLAAPLLRTYVGRANAFDCALLTIRSLLSVAFLRSYTSHHTGVMLSPLTGVLATLRFTQASLRPVRSWRGRTY